MTNDETELAIIELQELRNRMDRAIEESAKGEGTDGESFMQEILDGLDSHIILSYQTRNEQTDRADRPR